MYLSSAEMSQLKTDEDSLDWSSSGEKKKKKKMGIHTLSVLYCPKGSVPPHTHSSISAGALLSPTTCPFSLGSAGAGGGLGAYSVCGHTGCF